MKSIIMYYCEHCLEKFAHIELCEEHEARHYGLDYAGYQEWKRLFYATKSAARRMDVHKCSDTEKAFCIACHELIDFERSHGLEGYGHPENWT